MNKKQVILFSLISLMLTSGIYLWSSILINSNRDDIRTQSTSNPELVKTANSIPYDYYQDLEIGKDYVYNVTGFGANSVWTDFTAAKTDWKTDIDEQIVINFTGFFDRDPNDPGDTFPNVDMPWMNISIFELGGLLNYTNVNVSNSEVSRNIRLGFANFQPGFLITVNHTDWIKSNATLEANTISADLTIEESYNFIYFKLEQNGLIDNKTELIYDRIKGLLVRANITVGTYHLEIFLESYALSFEREYIYDIIEFGPPGYGFYTDLLFTYLDTYALRKGSWLKINFTGYSWRDPNAFPGYDTFEKVPNRAWLDIKAVYNGDFSPIITMSLDNRSNQEVSVAFLLNIGPFVSGFLLPEINNKSFDMQGEAQIASSIINNALSYSETDLTITIDSKPTAAAAFPQETYLVYEKYTGLLLYADTTGQNYHLEMEIENYDLPEEVVQRLIDDDDDDDDDKKKKEQAIPSFPLIILIGIVSTCSLIIILRVKKKLTK